MSSEIVFHYFRGGGGGGGEVTRLEGRCRHIGGSG